MMQTREEFLAECLIESIEDENYRNVRQMLIKFNADPNCLLPERGIAPIHYAAGMENTDFAEAAMKLMLKRNGNPNTQTIDGETPLHVAAIWNRVLIIEMLLDHGADTSIKDCYNCTPIDNAIAERHANLIPIFQNHEFEKKLEKKSSIDNQLLLSPTPTITLEKTPTKAMKYLELPKRSEGAGLLTPNQTNFNFKEASPFMVKIKRSKAVNKDVASFVNEDRRRKNKRTISVDELIGKENGTEADVKAEPNPPPQIQKDRPMTEDDDDDVFVVEENLFQLTEDNLERHLRMMPQKNRLSLVQVWQKKVNSSKRRESILPANESEFDAFITRRSNFFEEKSSSNASTQCSDQSANTVVPAIVTTAPQLSPSSANDTFVTAYNESGVIVLVEKELSLHENDEETLVKRASEHKQNEGIIQQQEMFEHTDSKNDIVFYERKLTISSTKSIVDLNKMTDRLDVTSESGTCTEFSVPASYNTDDLRKELNQFGDTPGPITTKSIKRLYLKRLFRYKHQQNESKSKRKESNIRSKFSIELEKTLRDDSEIILMQMLANYGMLESQMAENFQNNSNKRFREGILKKSFNYLLIDPRISENLPAESLLISKQEAWRRFINSIFYVGKGKSSRPYAHLYEAIKIYQSKTSSLDMTTKDQESLKLDRIIEIWRANKGVICLPIFHNTIPIEAYTREASMIDCLGVQNLTNVKRGDYYGIAKSWSMRQRKQLGVLLLYKAMHIFIAEGESQLRPDDIQSNA